MRINKKKNLIKGLPIKILSLCINLNKYCDTSNNISAFYICPQINSFIRASFNNNSNKKNINNYETLESIKSKKILDNFKQRASSFDNELLNNKNNIIKLNNNKKINNNKKFINNIKNYNYYNTYNNNNNNYFHISKNINININNEKNNKANKEIIYYKKNIKVSNTNSKNKKINIIKKKNKTKLPSYTNKIIKSSNSMAKSKNNENNDILSQNNPKNNILKYPQENILIKENHLAYKGEIFNLDDTIKYKTATKNLKKPKIFISKIENKSKQISKQKKRNPKSCPLKRNNFQKDKIIKNNKNKNLNKKSRANKVKELYIDFALEELQQKIAKKRLKDYQKYAQK